MDNSDWLWTDCPGRLLGDRTLVGCLKGVDRALLKRDMEGFCLAFPYSPHDPFPIPPLFCLSRVDRMGGRRYVVFRFSRRGRPEILHNISADGQDRGVP